MPAVEAVCNADSDLNIDFLDGLTQLLNKNLIKREIGWEKVGDGVDEDDGDVRFTMLETIHEFTAELLAESGEEQKFRLFHAEYFLAISSNLDFTVISGSERRLFRQLEMNNDNLRAALNWTIQHGRLDLAAQFVVAVPRYWETKSYFAEGRYWMLRIVSAQPPPEELDRVTLEKRAVMLLFAGRMSIYLSDYVEARALTEDSASIVRELGLDSLLRSVHQQLGLAAWLHGDYATSRSIFEEILSRAEEQGTALNQANGSWMVGIVVGEAGDFERGERLLNNARHLAKEAADVYVMIGATRDLATILCYEGRFAEALPLLEEALAKTRNAKFEVGGGWIYYALGLTMLGMGDLKQAVAYFRESLMLSRKTEKHRIPDYLAPGLRWPSL